MALDKLKPNKKARPRRRRLGRGNSSGRGTYSTRGIKGQKARSGVSGLKRLGLKQVLRATPKKRGFKSLKPKNQVVNVGVLDKYFSAGQIVSPASLAKVGLIAKIKKPVKILGQGKLKVSGLIFKQVQVSAKAKEQIKAQGGQIKAN